MHPFPLLPKKQPKPLRPPSHKQDFHKLLKEAYLALEDDLVEEKNRHPDPPAHPLPGHFHARPQPHPPAGLTR